MTALSIGFTVLIVGFAGLIFIAGIIETSERYDRR